MEKTNVTKNYSFVQRIEEHWVNKGLKCKIEIYKYEDDFYFEIILNGKIYGDTLFAVEVKETLCDINTYMSGIYDAVNNINEYKVI